MRYTGRHRYVGLHRPDALRPSVLPGGVLLTPDPLTQAEVDALIARWRTRPNGPFVILDELPDDRHSVIDLSDPNV